MTEVLETAKVMQLLCFDLTCLNLIFVGSACCISWAFGRKKIKLMRQKSKMSFSIWCSEEKQVAPYLVKSFFQLSWSYKSRNPLYQYCTTRQSFPPESQSTQVKQRLFQIISTVKLRNFISIFLKKYCSWTKINYRRRDQYHHNNKVICSVHNFYVNVLCKEGLFVLT